MLNTMFDNTERPVHHVKITTEHEIGEALLGALGIDLDDEDIKQLVLTELPNVAPYIRQPILDAIQMEKEARGDDE